MCQLRREKIPRVITSHPKNLDDFQCIRLSPFIALIFHTIENKFKTL